jgi:hypothetical protein
MIAKYSLQGVVEAVFRCVRLGPGLFFEGVDEVCNVSKDRGVLEVGS